MSKTLEIKNINSFELKIIAIIAMTINHAGYIFKTVLPDTIYVIMIGIGGFTFPIMAYLMLIGYENTKDFKKYIGRLLLFAAISQLPYTYALFQRPNVLFTLSAGLLLFWLYDRLYNSYINQIIFWILSSFIIAITYGFDWGITGPISMLTMKILEKYSKWIAILFPIITIGIINIISGCYSVINNDISGHATVCYGVANILSVLLLINYNNERGQPLKYFFYFYYPAHITMLYLISLFFV